MPYNALPPILQLPLQKSPLILLAFLSLNIPLLYPLSFGYFVNRKAPSGCEPRAREEAGSSKLASPEVIIPKVMPPTVCLFAPSLSSQD